MFNLIKKEEVMDKSENIRKQTVVLARLNTLLDVICYATDKKVKLEQELKQLEQKEKENEQQEVA